MRKLRFKLSSLFKHLFWIFLPPSYLVDCFNCISQFQKKDEREMSLSPFYSVNKSSVFKLGWNWLKLRKRLCFKIQLS